MRKKKKVCFVIAPIGKEKSEIRERSDKVFDYIIEPGVNECGYEAIRADKISIPGIITSQIIQHLIKDPIVVADLTGHNPNVFYELAIRHATKKPFIQIIQIDEKIPFDITQTRTIQFDYRDLRSAAYCKEELIKQIHAIEKDPIAVDSPIAVSRGLELLRQSENPLNHISAEIISMLKEIPSKKEDINEVLEKFGRSIITYHDLVQIEGSVKNNRNIWVLTSALELEVDELKETINMNLRNGIKYTYLIPKDDTILQKRMKKLTLRWKKECGLSVEKAQKQIKCLLVPAHFTYMTVIVYEPYEKQATVLVKFPTSSIYEKEKYPFIYRVDTKPKEAWQSFVNNLEDLIDDNRECRLTESMNIDFTGKNEDREEDKTEIGVSERNDK